MHKAKKITAFFLLVAYSIGFVHTLVPHNHEDETVPKTFLYQENAFRHNNNSNDDDHNHIEHANHEDEGLWGFLSCIIQKISHSKSLDTYVNSDVKLKLNCDEVFVLSMLNLTTSIGSAKSIKSEKLIDSYLNIYSLTAVFSSCSLRGPPPISC